VTYIEHLIEKAEGIWAKGGLLPWDLTARMVNEGIDVDRLEQRFHATTENQSETEEE
jgi:hypothetical protein